MLLILGWVSVALWLALAFAPLWFPTRGPPAEITHVQVMMGFGAYCMLCLVVGAAIRRYKLWAKIGGVGISLLSLPYFPFGTLFGIAALVYLVRGWSERPEI
jgi:hypothetical protein